MGIFKEFINFLFKGLYHIHKSYSMSFSYASAMLQHSVTTVIRFPGSDTDIFSWILLIMVFIWDWKDSNSRGSNLAFTGTRPHAASILNIHANKTSIYIQRIIVKKFFLRI